MGAPGLDFETWDPPSRGPLNSGCSCLPLAVCLCDNREGFVTLSCRNLEAFLFSSL